MKNLDHCVEKAISCCVFPGASYALVTPDQTIIGACGRHTYEFDAQPVNCETLFDLASLTKVIATTSICQSLIRKNVIRLDQPVHEFVPEFSIGEKQFVTLEDLLTHRSGLPAHKEFWRECVSRNDVIYAALSAPLETHPGDREQYSDIGFIVLGHVLERATERSLEQLWLELASEWKMISCQFNPITSDVAPTEIVNNIVKCGVVHDENSEAMSGVAGHAGLFASVNDLAAFCQVLLRSKKMQEWGKPRSANSSRGLGWNTNSQNAWWVGDHSRPHVFGHTGFTGTVFWCDPLVPFAAALLTNRVHPSRDNMKHRGFFPEFFDTATQIALTLS